MGHLTARQLGSDRLQKAKEATRSRVWSLLSAVAGELEAGTRAAERCNPVITPLEKGKLTHRHGDLCLTRESLLALTRRSRANAPSMHPAVKERAKETQRNAALACYVCSSARLPHSESPMGKDEQRVVWGTRCRN